MITSPPIQVFRRNTPKWLSCNHEGGALWIVEWRRGFNEPTLEQPAPTFFIARNATGQQCLAAFDMRRQVDYAIVQFADLVHDGRDSEYVVTLHHGRSVANEKGFRQLAERAVSVVRDFTRERQGSEHGESKANGSNPPHGERTNGGIGSNDAPPTE